MTSKQKKNDVKPYLWIVAFATILSIFLINTIVFEKIELVLEDIRFAIGPRIQKSNEIIIVPIDEQTFANVPSKYPYPRSFYASLIENLQKAQPKLIIIDIEFTEKDHANPEQDSIFAETLMKYDNIILAGKIIREKKNNVIYEQLLPPIESLQKADNWGLVNIPTDIDGKVRFYYIYDKFDDSIFSSIGLKALEKLEGAEAVFEEGIIKIGKYIIPTDQRKIILNYVSPEKNFSNYSFDTVLDSKEFEMPDFDLDTFEDYLEQDVFRDKIILIGATVPELHDLFFTPYSSFGSESRTTPGVEVHANFINMVMTGSFIAKVHHLYIYLLMLLVSISINAWMMRFKPISGLFLSIVIIFGYFGFAIWIFSSKGVLIHITAVLLVCLVSYFSDMFYQYIRDKKEKHFLKNTFKQYVSKDIVDKILQSGEEVVFGGERKVITILFSDVRSFTPFCEKNDPEAVVSILKEYLTEMVHIIIKNNGTIDKFIGDAIMVLFGAPYHFDGHAYAACKAALEMREKMTELQEKWRSNGKPVLEIGIGINTGEVIVGNLGSEQILDYTAIGDTVNLGARLESLNKQFETEKHIIISEFVFEQVKDKVKADYLDDVIVKGKSKKVKIYELREL